MRKKAGEGAAENFLMYFSSIIAVFLISSFAFSNVTFQNNYSSSVQLSSGLFAILALSMFLYIVVKVRGARI